MTQKRTTHRRTPPAASAGIRATAPGAPVRSDSDWLASLPVFDASSLPVFDTSTLPALAPEAADTVKAPQAKLKRDLILRRRVEKRRCVDLRCKADAIEKLDPLPAEKGDNISGTMSGSFHAWSAIEAVIELAQPAIPSRLWISTLGFNRANLTSLLDMLDTGKIGGCVFLASTYFSGVDRLLCNELTVAFAERKQKFVICRTHAKTVGFEGLKLTWQSSANMRSCRNLEVYSLDNDQDYLQQQIAWMTELIEVTVKEGRR